MYRIVQDHARGRFMKHLVYAVHLCSQLVHVSDGMDIQDCTGSCEGAVHETSCVCCASMQSACSCEWWHGCTGLCRIVRGSGS